jgi:hypothetical protein
VEAGRDVSFHRGDLPGFQPGAIGLNETKPEAQEGIRDPVEGPLAAAH